MTDLSDTIAPKTDQLNADDLIAGPIKITITKVVKKDGDKQQPTWIYYQGDNGKPWKPCLGMRRILIEAWGTKGDDYVGRAAKLYRDKEVIYGGKKQGGIRISHLSHIDAPMETLVTIRKGFREPFTVHPLSVVAKKEITEADKAAAARKKADAIIAAIANAQTAYGVAQVDIDNADALDRLEANYPALAEEIANQRAFKIDSFLTNQGV